MKHLLFSCLFSLFCFSNFVFADSSEKGSSQAKGRTAWIVTTHLPELINNPITLEMGEKTKELAVSKRSVSEPFEIPEDGLIRIIQKTENAGETTTRELAKFQISDGVMNTLVILIPDLTDEKKPIFQVKTQDLSSFKPGGWLFFNGSQHRVKVEFGEETMILGPGDLNPQHPTAQGESLKIAMSFSAAGDAPEKWKMIGSSSVAIYESRREICIFHWDKSHERMDYHGITFSVP